MMNAMIPGLDGAKMSSSIPSSKIDFLDTPEAVQRKISNAICEDGLIERNSILPILKEVLLPLNHLRAEQFPSQSQIHMEINLDEHSNTADPSCYTDSRDDGLFSVPVRGHVDCSIKYYRNYSELEDDFKARNLTSEELKTAVAKALNKLLDPLRKAYEENEERRNVTRLGYSDE